jgi:hypothetical protein
MHHDVFRIVRFEVRKIECPHGLDGPGERHIDLNATRRPPKLVTKPS